MQKSAFIVAFGAALLLTASVGARAQEITAERDCATDIKTVCAGVGPGQGRIQDCMKKHMNELSVGCSTILSKALWLGNECYDDIHKFCPHAKYGGIADCMRPHFGEVSDSCKSALAFISSPAGDRPGE